MRALLLLDKVQPAHDENAATLSKVLESVAPFTGPCLAHSDDVACILSTSGTTGKPKAALFTHNNLLYSERVFSNDLELGPTTPYGCPPRLNHATGFFHGLISPMLTGGRCVLQLRFKADEAVELINRENVSWSCGATPFVHDLLKYLEESGKAIPPSSTSYAEGTRAGKPHRDGEPPWVLLASCTAQPKLPHLRVPARNALSGTVVSRASRILGSK